MLLINSSFRFAKGTVTWRAKDDNPFYTGKTSKYIGKRYKWEVTVSYGETEYVWYTFASPNSSNALRYLRSLKKDLLKQNF